MNRVLYIIMFRLKVSQRKLKTIIAIRHTVTNLDIDVSKRVWPTVLSVAPLVQYVVCLSVCLSVCL